MRDRLAKRSICLMWATLVALSMSGLANAQATNDDGPIVVKLVFASDGCGDLRDLRKQINERSNRIAFEDGAQYPSVKVQIHRSEASTEVRARVDFEEVMGRPFSRELSAANCGELLAATGFVIAVTLDPPHVADPATEQPAEPKQSTPDETSDSSTSTRPNESNSSTAPSRPSDEPPRNTRRIRISRRALSRGETDSPGLIQLAAGGGFVFGASPNAMPGGYLRLGWRWLRHQPPLEAPNKQSGRGALVLLELSYAVAPPVRQTGGRADFRLATASALLCPGPLLRGLVVGRVCALATAGELQAEGSETLEAESHRRQWGVLGAALHFRIGIGTRWYVDVLGAGGYPLVRDRYQFEPEIIHEVPIISARAGLSIGLEL